MYTDSMPPRRGKCPTPASTTLTVSAYQGGWVGERLCAAVAEVQAWDAPCGCPWKVREFVAALSNERFKCLDDLREGTSTLSSWGSEEQLELLQCLAGHLNAPCVTVAFPCDSSTVVHDLVFEAVGSAHLLHLMHTYYTMQMRLPDSKTGVRRFVAVIRDRDLDILREGIPECKDARAFLALLSAAGMDMATQQQLLLCPQVPADVHAALKQDAAETKTEASECSTKPASAVFVCEPSAARNAGENATLLACMFHTGANRPSVWSVYQNLVFVHRK
jgi:hypothetical protein